MDQDKKKFNIDLDFLDEDTKEKPKTPPKTKEADSGSKPHDPKDHNWTYYKGGSNSGAKNPPKTVKPSSSGMSDTAKKWAWGIGIVVVIAILSSLGGGSSTSTNSTVTTANTNSNGQVQNDGYMCSSSDDAEAHSLDPDADNSTINGINADQAALDRRSAARRIESSRIDAEKDTVDDATYNADVDAYNASLEQYKLDLAALNTRIDAYNVSEQAHNNYLAQNCTKN
jgi:hypothetical protein